MESKESTVRSTDIVNRLTEQLSDFYEEHPEMLDVLKIFADTQADMERSFSALNNARITVSTSSYGTRETR